MISRTIRQGRRVALIFGLVALLTCGVHAEDIDIYQGAGGNGGAANLLIILDNSGASNASATYNCGSDGLTPGPDDPGGTSGGKNNGKGNNGNGNNGNGNGGGGTGFGFERCGLYQAIKSIQNDPSLLGNINVGLMYFAGAKRDNGPNDGGLFYAPPRSSMPIALPNMDTQGVTAMLNRIADMNTGSDTANKNRISESMQEAWAFYQRKVGLSGTDYKNVPADTYMCARNFVLYIGYATNSQGPQGNDKDAADKLKAAADIGSITQLPVPLWKSPVTGETANAGANDEHSNTADEWAQFMHAGTLPGSAKAYPSIDTYSLILSDGKNPKYEQLMVSMARNGGGDYVVINPNEAGSLDQFVKALVGVFHNVQAVNGAFAAPVLPVSANTQETYQNQVFLGVFRPDQNGKPRWVGNLKQYRFGATENVTVDLFMADANGKPALNPATGFFKPDAVSYWTRKDTENLPDKVDANKGGFWLNSYLGLGAADGFDLPDGQFVEKGGAGQQARLKLLTSTDQRNVYTCPQTGCSAGSALSNNAFDDKQSALTDNPGPFGLPTSATSDQRKQFVNWVRGADTASTAGDAAAGVEANSPRADPSIKVRGSVHGDVLHSRPAVANYAGNTGTVVFYGSNDGMFRAVNGNQPGNCPGAGDCAIGDVPAGGELWSFVAPEFFGCLGALYHNTSTLQLGATAPAGTSCNDPKNPSGKPYFFDGTPTVYHDETSKKWYLFAPARRGGRILYAFDITDPAAPKFLWKIAGGSGDFAELGQTWSQPKAARVKGNPGPVLIFGGGYDVNQDGDPPASTDKMGRAIFVVDAVSGALLWQASYGESGADNTCTTSGKTCQLKGMTYSIPADVTLVDTNRNGTIDRLYAADTGGNLWRVDLEPDGTGAVNTWKAYRLAALGGSGNNKRKFLFAPDVVLVKEYHIVAAVSGDREHPLEASGGANSVVNRFYMIRDTHAGADGAANWEMIEDNTDSSKDTKPDHLEMVPMDGSNLVDPADESVRGYYISLNHGPGEKGVNAPTTMGGATYFGTNRPTPKVASGDTLCRANLGEARGYKVNLFTGKTLSNPFTGGGLPPSPVAGVLEIDVNGEPQKVPFVIGSPEAQSPLEASSVDSVGSKLLFKTYWSSQYDQGQNMSETQPGAQ